MRQVTRFGRSIEVPEVCSQRTVEGAADRAHRPVLKGMAEDQTHGALFEGDAYWGDLNDRVYCRIQEHWERITGFWYDTIPGKDEIESRVKAGTIGQIGKVFFMTRENYTDYQRYCKWLEPTPEA